MLLYSSMNSNAVAPKTAVLSTVVAEKPLTSTAVPKSQIITGKVSFSSSKKSYKVTRRYTIDDNGG